MNASLRKSLVREAAWGLSLTAAVALLIGLSLSALGGRRTDVRGLEQVIDARRADLDARPGKASRGARAQAAAQTLREWRDVVGDEGRRVAALSRAAQEAGMRVVSLRIPASTPAEGSALLESEHLLLGAGTYRAVATFLGSVAGLEGLASVGEVELRPRDGGAPGELEASLRIS